MPARQSTETGRPTSSPTGPAADAMPEPSTDRADQITAVAYQLYEARGRADGHDLDDWLQAEQQVLGTQLKAAA